MTTLYTLQLQLQLHSDLGIDIVCDHPLATIDHYTKILTINHTSGWSPGRRSATSRPGAPSRSGPLSSPCRRTPPRRSPTTVGATSRSPPRAAATSRASTPDDPCSGPF